MSLDDEKESHDDDAPETLDDQPGEDDADGLDGDEDGAEDELPAGDEAEDDGGEAPDQVDDERPSRSPSRIIRDEKKGRKAAETRAEEASRKADEALRRAEAAERRAEDAERRSNERRQAETAEAEAARLELMSESEKIAHYRQKDKEEHGREMAGVKYQIWDSTDRAEFRQLARDEPAIAKVRDQVEAEFQRLAAQGRPVARELLANQAIAKMVREGRGPAATRQRDGAKKRIDRETVRAPRTRSDVAPQRTRRGEMDEKAARRKRLEGVEL